MHIANDRITKINAENERLIERDLTEQEENLQAEWIADQRDKRLDANTALKRAVKGPRRPVQHRPGTLERQETRALYGKWDSTKGTCPTCFMVLPKSGVCDECA